MATDVKQYVEMRVATKFFEHLQGSGAAVLNLRHNPNDPPDALIDTPSGLWGIEHASAYYNSREAANTSAILRNTPEKSHRWIRPGEYPYQAARRMPILVNFDDDLMVNLQRTLDEHARKVYGMPTFLVLDATMAPLTVARKGPEFVDSLTLPSKNPFKAVYLALTTNRTADMEFFQVL